MKNLFNLSIRAKLLGGFAMLLALTGVLGGIAIQQVNSLSETLKLTQGKEAFLGRAQAALWELRYGVPQYLVLTDAENRQKIVGAEAGWYAMYEKNLAAYAAAPGLSPEEVQGHKLTHDAWLLYKSARPRWFALMGEGKPEEAFVYREGTLTPRGAAGVKAINNLIDLTSKNDAARRAAQEQSADQALKMLAIVGLATLLFGVGAAAWVFRSINKPLRHLQATIGRLNEGDYRARARMETRDELGVLGRSLDTLLDERVDALAKTQLENEQLNNSVVSILQAVHQLSQRDLTARAPVTKDIIGTVSDSVNALAGETAKVMAEVAAIAGNVAQASGKVKGQADLVSRTAEDERRSVGEVIDSLTQATQTMNQVAVLAEQSNRSAERATQATDSALETVNGTVKGMESIRETIAETEKRIKRLGERSQEITGIVNLINTISERTHVLALNASMQAAVAGEAGRGFAVVAEEVQRLAESSRNATQQIGTLVNNIQLETNETIATVNRTIGQVVAGSEQAQKAGEKMRQTQEITGELVAQVQRIASASEHQKAASAELLKSVQTIGTSTERTAEQIATQNRETETLLESARRLVQSVNVFKLAPA